MVSQVRLITAEKVVGLVDTAVRWVGLVVDGAAAVVTDEVVRCRVVAGCVDVVVVFSVAVVCACVVGLCVVIGCVVGLCIISGCVVGPVVVGLCVVTSGVVGLCVVTGCVVPIAVSCLLAVV